MLNVKRRFPEFTYAKPSDPPLTRWVIGSLERAAGRDYFAPLYEHWRAGIVPSGHCVMRPMLGLISVDLQIMAAQWPATLDPARPLVLIANHPFGILDGIAALTLAEDLGRPFKVLINKDIMAVPETRPYSLPIDFEKTRAAQQTNLSTRKEALRLLAEGTTIVVFPAGGVATAPGPFGRAVDLPWKGFVARLVQSSKASVLPVYFEGQCSPLFHFVSRYSLTLRLSLLIREFRQGVGRPIVARVGAVVPFEDLNNRDDRKALLDDLFQRVYALSGSPPPSQDGLPDWLLGPHKGATSAEAQSPVRWKQPFKSILVLSKARR